MSVCWRRGVSALCRGMPIAGVAFGFVGGLPGIDPAAAQNYPTRTVTIIVPFSAGSVTDAAARLLGHHLQETLGQPFVIENKSGAGGLIAASAVARAEPDATRC
jgi:tripartite-type tricarboxylate transporter receptor subunit TctC